MTLDELLAPDRLVDLSQPLAPGMGLWPGSSPVVAKVTANHPDDGMYNRDLELPEHVGTHLDAPIHFAPEGATVDRLPLGSLVRPAVKLDVRPWVAGNPHATFGRGVLEELEERDGPIPTGSAVLIHTGWDAHVGDPRMYFGEPLAFPGPTGDAAELFVERGIAGLGLDTPSVDVGTSTEHPVHHTTLPAGIWHLEGLVGLEHVPARGAWLVVGALPLVGGSGTPVRVFAILPPPPG